MSMIQHQGSKLVCSIARPAIHQPNGCIFVRVWSYSHPSSCSFLISLSLPLSLSIPALSPSLYLFLSLSLSLSVSLSLSLSLSPLSLLSISWIFLWGKPAFGRLADGLVRQPFPLPRVHYRLRQFTRAVEACDNAIFAVIRCDYLCDGSWKFACC